MRSEAKYFAFSTTNTLASLAAPRRFPRNTNGMVSLTEFITFVRERQPKSPEEDKLRKILKKAEAMGKSVEDIFGFFDKDGTGEITLAEFRDGLSQLGSFSKLSNKEFKR